MRLGALEAGGTTMVCGIGDETGKVATRVTFPTRLPEETLTDLITFFREANIEALGIASFGPLDLHRDSPTFGHVTSTPKKGWADYPLLPRLRDALHVPVGLDTDVNAAAFAEHRLGAAAGLANCLYLTVGTGIGGGIVAENNVVHGLTHPEFGHFWLRPHPDDPAPHGFCPFHDGCLEGLASGQAIAERWGKPASELPQDHDAWRLEVHYLAQACATAIVVLSPERIILGGGVMRQEHLFPRIRLQVVRMLGGYVRHPAVLRDCDRYIVPPGLGRNSGMIGALLLAASAGQQS